MNHWLGLLFAAFAPLAIQTLEIAADAPAQHPSLVWQQLKPLPEKSNSPVPLPE